MMMAAENEKLIKNEILVLFLISNLSDTATSHVRSAKMLCTFLSFYGIFGIDGTDDVHKY